MKTYRLKLVILTFIISFSALAAPARRDPVPLVQPDGTTFSARIRGDEFMKVMTTLDGCSIIRDEDGWWCYAHYDEDGIKASSGYRVGTDVPAGVMARSRSIPYDKLSSNSLKKIHPEEEPILARILRRKGPATKGEEVITKHGLVILAQFKDLPFSHTHEDFVNMLTQPGYSANGATGSAKEYFDAQFNGAFEFAFDVSPIVTLPQNMAFYGENDASGTDRNPVQMIIDACDMADEFIDFSLYDDDGDGYVDNVFVFFAGNDEAEMLEMKTDCIWSHAYYVYSGGHRKVVLDGKVIDRYACTSELSRRYTTTTNYRDVMAGIGTFCHEYFHTFGIPDMYDSDYDSSDGQAAALWGATSLMDSGNQNNFGNTPPNLNAVEREYMGISEPILIDSNGGYTLEPIRQEGKFYRIDTDHADEYYLLEYRDNKGWDKFTGGSGMLIYHIDKSDRRCGYSDNFGKNSTARERWEETNEVNCRPDHQCADLIEADRRQDGFTLAEEDLYYSQLKSIRGVFFPWKDNNSLVAGDESGLTYWSGAPAKASITNIQKTDNGILFNVTGFDSSELPPEVKSIKAEAFSDAAIILFESDRKFEGKASVTWGRTGSEGHTLSLSPYEPGKYSLTLESLAPDNKTYTVKVHFELDGLIGEESSVSFMTKKSPGVEWPFILIGGVRKNSDGTLPVGGKIPLRIGNRENAAEIRWEFNGEEIKPGGDGYFTVEKDGMLKAHIIWEDGSEETLMKEIITGNRK